MPQNTTVTYPANTWTQITDANVSAIRVQNQSIFTVNLSATSGTVAPTNLSGSIELAEVEVDLKKLKRS